VTIRRAYHFSHWVTGCVACHRLPAVVRYVLGLRFWRGLVLQTPSTVFAAAGVEQDEVWREHRTPLPSNPLTVLRHHRCHACLRSYRRTHRRHSPIPLTPPAPTWTRAYLTHATSRSGTKHWMGRLSCNLSTCRFGWRLRDTARTGQPPPVAGGFSGTDIHATATFHASGRNSGAGTKKGAKNATRSLVLRFSLFIPR